MRTMPLSRGRASSFAISFRTWISLGAPNSGICGKSDAEFVINGRVHEQHPHVVRLGVGELNSFLDGHGNLKKYTLPS